MWDIIVKLVKADPDVVFVGSVASILNSVITEDRKELSECKDIDILVDDTRRLETLGRVFNYEGLSVYSSTKKRSYMVLNDLIIDIFIEPIDEKDIRIITEGNNTIKIVTLSRQVDFYKERLDIAPEKIKDTIKKKYDSHLIALKKNKNIL
jgi:hypothetical protein